MILVDTSVWADHFGKSDPALFQLLDQEEVLGHPYITAELALGSLADPAGTIALLEALPQGRVATQAELMMLIRRERLAGTGVGFVDAHLLASARLSATAIWTRDKRLRSQAEAWRLAWTPE